MATFGDVVEQIPHQLPWCVDPYIASHASMRIWKIHIDKYMPAGCLSQISTYRLCKATDVEVFRLAFLYLMLYSGGLGSLQFCETFVFLTWAWKMWMVVPSDYRTDFFDEGLKR